jgi:uncharacterized SAM-dependent methyltransferase
VKKWLDTPPDLFRAIGEEQMAKPRAFVAMAYKEPFNLIYRDVIKPVLTNCGFSVLRADEMVGSTAWWPDTEDQIAKCDLLIADVTGSNPNVYEYGIARALRKDAILLAQDPDTLPADTRAVRHIKYDPANHDALRKEFEKWVLSSKAYTLSARRITPQVMTRGDVFTSITDATFYMHHVLKDDKTDILGYIHGRRLIPPSYLYRFGRGAALWLDLCHDPQYHYFTKSVEFFQRNIDEILNVIDEKIIADSPDLISLGPGSGIKDRIFLMRLLDRQPDSQSDMYYYPYDISPSMISSAIGAISTNARLRSRLKVKAVVADFNMLKLFEPVYQYRPETNIFTLLGNTLGNIENETNFLDQIKRAMFTDDILIVEVRAKTTEKTRPDSIGGSFETNKKFDFTPLDFISVHFEDEKLSYEPAENRSNIPGSKTVMACYSNFYIPGEINKIDAALLSYIHEYDPEQLKRVIESVGFKILKTFFGVPGVACYVLKKPA